MPKRKHARKTEKPKAAPITGTYKYDPKTGKIVKVSDRIPKVASQGGKDFPCGADSSSEGLPCGQSECGGGSCDMGGLDD
ncbi:MAG: hypothetical protein HY748_13505 [Elusimicrobia bacterium]|nr:hypothetical protein [Elusimicrobiota bacterium]